MNGNERKWFKVEGENYRLDCREKACRFIHEDLTVCNDPDQVCFADTVAYLRLNVNETYEVTVVMRVGGKVEFTYNPTNKERTNKANLFEFSFTVEDMSTGDVIHEYTTSPQQFVIPNDNEKTKEHMEKLAAEFLIEKGLVNPSFKNPIPSLDDEYVSERYCLVFKFDEPVTLSMAAGGINNLISENGGVIPEAWIRMGHPKCLKLTEEQ